MIGLQKVKYGSYLFYFRFSFSVLFNIHAGIYSYADMGRDLKVYHAVNK
jgi:hypothetical protein